MTDMWKEYLNTKHLIEGIHTPRSTSLAPEGGFVTAIFCFNFKIFFRLSYEGYYSSWSTSSESSISYTIDYMVFTYMQTLLPYWITGIRLPYGDTTNWGLPCSQRISKLFLLKLSVFRDFHGTLSELLLPPSNQLMFSNQ